MAQITEGGPHSDELPERLRPQTVEPGVTVAGNHLDTGTLSLGGGYSGCGCCCGRQQNHYWGNGGNLGRVIKLVRAMTHPKVFDNDTRLMV